jgi:amino acid adenylation domain-containing protein/non-ribosomal peptide synthase protein (TIGR01720 family)
MIADLSPEELELLQRRLQEQIGADTFPLTFAQERLWVLDQLFPNNPFYNIPASFTMPRGLNLVALRQSLDAIIGRHETLRTIYMQQGNRPIQLVRSAARLPIIQLDLRGLPAATQVWALKRFAAEEALRPFALKTGPLIRITLLCHDDDQHMLVVTMHHIISDGWSIDIFIHELALGYAAAVAGQPAALAELPIQYGDYALWQREWLRGERLDQHIDYWSHQLEQAPTELALFIDHPRPALPSFRGASCPLIVPSAQLDALRALSQRAGTTLFMTLCAVFHSLLYRLTYQDDMLIGIPVSTRDWPEIVGLIGFFVNTLVLRLKADDNVGFRAQLAQVRRVALEAYQHQDVPFEKLVEALQPTRDLSRNPLFQVMFSYREVLASAPDMPSTSIYLAEDSPSIAKFDLTLALEHGDDALSGALIYSIDLFEKATISRMLRQLLTLTEGIIADPDARVADLPLLNAAERRMLLTQWNDTGRPYPDDSCIHTLFEQQVAQNPHAIAVVLGAAQLSYAELNRRANQLAHFLLSRAIGPQVLVGICVERSIELIVGMLGILKAGGAYVPIDPAYPAERIAFMLEDTQAPVLITHQIDDLRLTIDDLEASQPPIVNRQSKIVNMQTDWSQIASMSVENPPNRAGPDNLAYIIYTSGSTGTPKGTMIAHRSVCNFINSTQTLFPIDARDRVLQFATCTFDVSVFETFSALLSGATLCLITRAVAVSPPALTAVIRDNQISVVDIPPVMLAQLPADAFPALRIALIGGESFTGELATRWQAAGRRFFNGYGPTESTVTMTLMECVGAYAKSPPIGRPMPNHQVYLLDRRLEPVPIGVPGELYVSGVGLAHGYLRRPALTAERFIPNPFADGRDEETGRPGDREIPQSAICNLQSAIRTRLYKTGDLCRYLPDGNMEFLGRIDQQVKIRGFRIELEEIAASLRSHPAVRDAAVLAREDVPGQRRLVAYVVTTNEAERDPSFVVRPASFAQELHSFLKRKLPEYMLPAGFVVLDALPMTSSGKLDRNALPAPDHARPALDEAFVAARTPTERTLAAIWKQVLGIDQVGVDDNFFLLGGDSLLALAVVGQANQAEIQLSAQQVFQYQTIAELAAAASVAPQPAAEQTVITGPVPLTPIQRWFFMQEPPQPHHWNQSLLLDVTQPLDPALVEQVVAHLLQHHDALRLRFNRSAAGWEQVNAADDSGVPLTWLNLPPLPPAAQDQAIATIADSLQASLNISQGPLLRVAFFDLGPDRPGRLLLIIHHLAVDGVSWRILLEDFQTLYRQLSSGAAAHLPPKTTSFKHWAEQLTRYAQTDAALRELDYWRAAAQPCDLPSADPADAENMAATARTHTVTMSAAATDLLLRTLPQLYQTSINAVLLLALARAFAAWTGQRTLLIELEGHGREEILPGLDLSRTVGWFTATFPVTLDLGPSDALRDELRAISQCLQGIPQRGIGYGILRYLHDDRRIAAQLRACPQPAVSFNYLGQSDQVAGAAALFRLADGPTGQQHDLRSKRAHQIELVGLITNHQFRMVWIYSAQLHQPALIERLAHDYLATLERLIAAHPQPGPAESLRR